MDDNESEKAGRDRLNVFAYFNLGADKTAKIDQSLPAADQFVLSIAQIADEYWHTTQDRGQTFIATAMQLVQFCRDAGIYDPKNDPTDMEHSLIWGFVVACMTIVDDAHKYSALTQQVRDLGQVPVTEQLSEEDAIWSDLFGLGGIGGTEADL